MEILVVSVLYCDLIVCVICYIKYIYSLPYIFMLIILRIFLNAGALLLIAHLVQGISLGGWYSAVITVFVLGIVNALIRPLLIILTLPVNILTLGLFTLVINGLMFWFASTIVKGFDVVGFWSAFWGALWFSIASWATSALVYGRKGKHW